MPTLFTLLLFALAVWFWLDSARAREIATGICKTGCRQRGLQFLDQTVALRRVTLGRTPRGVRLRRLFRFDFSEEGVGRRSGHISLIGISLEDFSLGLPTEPAPQDSGPDSNRPNSLH